MQILIIGGTGFLGYHATRELLARGHQVAVMALPPAPPAELFDQSVEIKLLDINSLDDSQMVAALTPYDAVVFAAGADDRVVPKSPAFTFFYEANIRTSVRVTAAARQAGVSRFVLLGSYFTHFDREWPELKLAEAHPYIHSRREQMQLCRAVAGSDMALTVLELPYIFGSMPNTVPLWEPLVNYVRSGVKLYYTNGGTNMVSVRHVAEAIAGACERIDQSSVFQVGERNVSWVEFFQALCAITGRKDDTVHIIDNDKIAKVGWVSDSLQHLFGKEAGLHNEQFIEVQTSYTYLDVSESRAALGFSEGDLENAWRETVAACPAKPRKNPWDKLTHSAKQFFSH